MDGITHVVHLASIAGVDTVMKQPALTMRVSLLGTANVLDAALESKQCQRFIDFSTSEVFGRYALSRHRVRTSPPSAPSAKRAGTYGRRQARHRAPGHDLPPPVRLFPPSASARFNIYGPRPGRRRRRAPLHRGAALKGEPLSVHNDGSQIRAWCYNRRHRRRRRARCSPTIRARRPLVQHRQPRRSTVTIYKPRAREIIRLASSGSKIEHVGVEPSRRRAARAPTSARPRSCSTGPRRWISRRACYAPSIGIVRVTNERRRSGASAEDLSRSASSARRCAPSTTPAFTVEKNEIFGFLGPNGAGKEPRH